jgi:hypothetical protein
MDAAFLILLIGLAVFAIGTFCASLARSNFIAGLECARDNVRAAQKHMYLDLAKEPNCEAILATVDSIEAGLTALVKDEKEKS